MSLVPVFTGSPFTVLSSYKTRQIVWLCACAFLLLTSGLTTIASAFVNQGFPFAKKVANRPQTIASLQMQQIHGLNFMVDRKSWQLKNIQTFEDEQRYEFSKNFICIAAQCPKKTLLTLTFVTYKYASKIYNENHLEKNFPLEKWKSIFKKGVGIQADFQEKISRRDRLGQTAYGYRYNTLKVGGKAVSGLIDMLYYERSQVRIMVSHPTKEQNFLQRLVTKIEQTLSLQQLR